MFVKCIFPTSFAVWTFSLKRPHFLFFNYVTVTENFHIDDQKKYF